MKPSSAAPEMQSHGAAAQLLLRLALGFFLIFEATGKFLVGYQAFVGMMSKNFTGTILPEALVNGFFHVAPIVELVLGIWVLLGCKRLWSLMATGIYLIILLFGHVLKGMPYEPLFILLITIALALKFPAACHCTSKEK